MAPRVRFGRSGRARAPPVQMEVPAPVQINARQLAFEAYLACDHKEPTWVDMVFVVKCEFSERFRELLTTCGWPGLMSLQCRADVEDTSEFLSGFHYDGHREGEGISYYFRGQQHHCSMAQLRQVFGWPEVAEDAYIAFRNERDRAETAMLLTGSEYFAPSESTSKQFRDPFWFFVHFIMTRTVFARANGNDKPTIRDYALLGALVRGVVPDWAHLMCSYWNTLRPRGPVCVGGMVTFLLRSLHPDVDALPEHRVLHCSYADQARVKSGRVFRVGTGGAIRWNYHADPAYHSPPSPPRPRGRPPGRGRAQRPAAAMALDIVPPAYQPPPQQSEGLSREQVYFMFNMTRTMMRAMRGGEQPVSPPPGWQPGQPIPPEYL